VVIQKKKPAPVISKSPLAVAVELVQRKAQVVPTKRRKILKKRSNKAGREVETDPLPCERT
jgi:hypothetical protein